MTTTLSSKGQIVLPAAARRLLGLEKGEQLSIEPREDGLFIRPVRKARAYRMHRDPKTGLPVMYPVKPTGRKVTVEEIARLNANLF